MKKLFTILTFSLLFSFAESKAFAQDSAKSSAAKHINETSEQADKLYGKKIQQQTLSSGSFEKTSLNKPKTSKKKYCAKCRHKLS